MEGGGEKRFAFGPRAMVYAHMLALYAYCMRYSIYARMCDPMSPSHIPLSSPRRLSACLRLAYLSVDWQHCCFVFLYEGLERGL